jgi:hypothetical protein
MEDCRNSVKLDLERISRGSNAIKLAREFISTPKLSANFKYHIPDFGLAPNRHAFLSTAIVDAHCLIKVEHGAARFEKTIGKSFHPRHTHQHHFKDLRQPRTLRCESQLP